MSPNQPADPDDVMVRLICGDLAPDDPIVARMLAEHPERAAELEAIRRVQQRLTQAAELEQSVLREAAAPSASAPTGRRSAHGRRWLAALAATVLLSSWLLLRAPHAPEPARLGSLKVTALQRDPSGGLRLRWTGELGPGEYYRVVVLVPGDGREIARSDGKLRSLEWTTPPSEVALPPTLVVEIAVLDAGGRPCSIARSTLPVPH